MVYVISSLVIPLSKINPLVFYPRIFRLGEAMSYVFVHKLLYISPSYLRFSNSFSFHSSTNNSILPLELEKCVYEKFMYLSFDVNYLNHFFLLYHFCCSIFDSAFREGVVFSKIIILL